MKLVLSIAIFSVILVGAFQGGESLKCIVCKSTNDGNCASAPEKIEARCSAVPPGPTEKPPTTTETPKPSSTVTPKPSTTEKPSSTETPQPTTEQTQPSSSQTPAPTTGATLPSSSQTSAPTSEATLPSSSQTSAPTSEATLPSSSQTSAPTSEATDPSSSQTPAPTSEATLPSSSQTSAPTSEATLPSSSQPSSTQPSSPQTPPPEAPKPSEPETLNQQGPQVKKMTHRSRRQAIQVFAAESHECYKIIYKENNEEVVERGCVAKKTSCEGLKAGKSEVECNVCSDEDDCNASSMLTSSLASMLLFVGVTLYLSR